MGWVDEDESFAFYRGKVNEVAGNAAYDSEAEEEN
jgi:hypothetical protein